VAPGLRRTTVYRFGSFHLSLRTGELRKHTARIRLQGQPLQILCMLLERRGEIVTREEMKERLWPADTFVDFEHSLNTAVKKLRQVLGDSATEPQFIETLPRVGYRFLPSVEEVVEGDHPESSTVPPLPASTSPPIAQPIPTREATSGRFATFARVALAFLVIAAVVLSFNIGRVRDRLFHSVRPVEKPAGAVVASVKPRASIAVLGFKNLTRQPEQEWLSTAFSEMLTTELGAGDKLRVISGENIARMKSDLSLMDTDSYTRESLKRIHGNLGSDIVVLGSYTALGEKAGRMIRLDLRLQDTATGETTSVMSITGTEDKLFDLVSQAGTQLRARLGVGTVPPADTAALLASLPETPKAAQLYAEGLVRMRAYDFLAARPLLENATQIAPKFALAHSALSAVWTNLGYEVKARDEAKRAFDLSASLSREQQLSIEGRYRSTTREWKKAVEIYRSLYTLYPDNLDYGLQLTNAEILGWRAKDALVLLGSFRQSTLAGAYAPRVDLQIAFAKQAVSDLNGAIEAARSAQAGSQAIGAKDLEARSWHLEGNSLLHSGQHDNAAKSLSEAQRIFDSIGNKGSAARVHCDLALIREDAGDLEGSRIMFEEALQVFRAIGDQSNTAGTLSDIASVLKQEGNLAGAKRMLTESLAISKEIGSRQTTTRFELATILYQEGDLPHARSEFEQLVAASAVAGDKFGISLSQVELANVLFAQGNVAAAKKMYQDSLAVTRELGDQDSTAAILENLAGVLLVQADLAAAHKSADEAMDVAQKLNEKSATADAQATLASVLLEEGRAEDAETQARQSAETLGAERAVTKQAVSRSLQAMALLLQNKLPEAEQVSRQAQATAEKSQFRGDREFIVIRDARVRAANGHPEDAARNLKAVRAEALRLGFVSQQLEARFVEAEIEKKSNKAAIARAHLSELEKEATVRGFLLIARKAHAAAE
jgi:eukaryotic-like serine/threonine-protein kinase